MIIFIAAAGLVWLVFCFNKYTKEVKTKGFKYIFASKWGKDFWGSIFFMVLGAIAFVGVTGMVIGLVASVMFSIIAWAMSIFNKG